MYKSKTSPFFECRPGKCSIGPINRELKFMGFSKAALNRLRHYDNTLINSDRCSRLRHLLTSWIQRPNLFLPSLPCQLILATLTPTGIYFLLETLPSLENDSSKCANRKKVIVFSF